MLYLIHEIHIINYKVKGWFNIMSKKALKEISELVNSKARVGMKLILGDKMLECISTLDTDRGIRYIFDNGIGWTKSNIESNIVLAVSKNATWGIL
jgi:hypothetical protein